MFEQCPLGFGAFELKGDHGIKNFNQKHFALDAERQCMLLKLGADDFRPAVHQLAENDAVFPVPGPQQFINQAADGLFTLLVGLDFAACQPFTVPVSQQAFAGVSRNFNGHDTEDTKIRPDGAAAAILLPVVLGREEYAEANNLALEFYFEDEYLEKKVDEHGLELESRVIQQVITELRNFKLPEIASDELHLRKIVAASKKHFAEKVVPTLPKEAFGNFQRLFEKVQATIETLRQKREQ